METLNELQSDGVKQIEDSSTAKVGSSSPSQITDPVVYKLVRVEGDGRLVPATDDEVMEVEDLLEDDKPELPLAKEPAHIEECLPNGGLSSKKTDLEDSDGGSLPSENTEVNIKKLNARREYIEVMLQKVKQEERLRLTCGIADHSSKYMNMDVQSSDQQEQFVDPDARFPSESSLQEIVPSLSPRLNDSHSTRLGSFQTSLKPADEPILSGSSVSPTCDNFKQDFPTTQGEICLDNLSIRELHETFRATFGRETSVKDKMWLKRRIAMGLTNSCDVSTTTFIIKDKSLVHKKVNEDGHCSVASSECEEGALPDNETSGVVNGGCQNLPTGLNNKMEGRPVFAGKRLRKPKTEYDVKDEDLLMEQTAAKRVRKPTRRYIEELSEVETRECSGRLISSVKNSGHGHSSPKSRVRPVCNVGSVGTTVVTRLDSLGGSGVRVPYVSRVRRGRPRKNFMALLKYHPSGMAAKLVKKALGVRAARQDSESGPKIRKSRAVSTPTQQPILTETEGEKTALVPYIGGGRVLITCTGADWQQGMQLAKSESSADDSDDHVATVPTAKGGTRRKHHRAWTLCEVMKLIEGVTRYGAGRWSEIKRLAFASYTYRTSVDLKDKWRNLLRASAQAPAERGVKNARKHASMPIPAPILARVRELAELHSQAASEESARKAVSRSGRSVHKNQGLDIYNCI